MPYFLVLISHVRTSQAYAYAYACAYRTSGNQALHRITGEAGSTRGDCDIYTGMLVLRFLYSLVVYRGRNCVDEYMNGIVEYSE